MRSEKIVFKSLDGAPIVTQNPDPRYVPSKLNFLVHNAKSGVIGFGHIE